MVECPHCHQRAISQLAKLMLGPARSTRCRSCGKHVSVSWLAMLGLIPFALGAVAVLWAGRGWLAASTIAVAMVLMFCFHAFCVPLVPRDI